VIDLVKTYNLAGVNRNVLNGISFRLPEGGSIGVVGKSGAGKSTLARLILGLEPPSGGSVRIDGEDFSELNLRNRKEAARKVQIIWQDPVVYLNPYLTALDLITEALAVRGIPRRLRMARAVELSDMVHLGRSLMGRKAHELSGGQAQRLAIARALALEPEILICDEALSSLDLPSRARLTDLLDRLIKETGMSLVFISHDIPSVARLCELLMVLDDGRIVEQGPVGKVLAGGVHPLTRAIVACSMRYSWPGSPVRSNL